MWLTQTLKKDSIILSGKIKTEKKGHCRRWSLSPLTLTQFWITQQWSGWQRLRTALPWPENNEGGVRDDTFCTQWTEKSSCTFQSVSTNRLQVGHHIEDDDVVHKVEESRNGPFEGVEQRGAGSAAQTSEWPSLCRDMRGTKVQTQS